MTDDFNPELDLRISRIIRAPRAAVWQAWADPRQFEQWWIPEPMRCRVTMMDLRPGGAFVTEMSDEGIVFQPHIDGCFLDVEEGRRIVWTTALLGGWRPAEEPFLLLTADISLADHPDGTEYSAHVMHKSQPDSAKHAELGFYEGWGTVLDQLAKLVERR